MKINKLCILLITGAVIGSVQAQTDKGGISPQQLEEIKKKDMQVPMPTGPYAMQL